MKDIQSGRIVAVNDDFCEFDTDHYGFAVRNVCL